MCEIYVIMLLFGFSVFIINLYEPDFTVRKTRSVLYAASLQNSYKVTEKELVSLSVYNVGFRNVTPLYQWGPGIRDHYLIHYIISGKGTYRVAGQTYHLSGGDTFWSTRTPRLSTVRMSRIPGNTPGSVLPEATPP